MSTLKDSSIRIPESNFKRLIFPYTDLSNSYQFSHYTPKLTKNQLPVALLQNFFTEVHRHTATDFNSIKKAQKFAFYGFPFLLAILITFCIVIGLAYGGIVTSPMVKVSLGIIVGSCGLFIILTLAGYFQAKNIQKDIKDKIDDLIRKSSKKFAQTNTRWIIANTDFPYWLELWLDQNNSPSKSSPDNYSSSGMGAKKGVSSPSDFSKVVERDIESPEKIKLFIN